MMIDLTDDERRVLLDACNVSLADAAEVSLDDRDLLRNLRVKLTAPPPPVEPNAPVSGTSEGAA